MKAIERMEKLAQAIKDAGGIAEYSSYLMHHAGMFAPIEKESTQALFHEKEGYVIIANVDFTEEHLPFQSVIALLSDLRDGWINNGDDARTLIKVPDTGLILAVFTEGAVEDLTENESLLAEFVAEFNLPFEECNEDNGFHINNGASAERALLQREVEKDIEGELHFRTLSREDLNRLGWQKQARIESLTIASLYPICDGKYDKRMLDAMLHNGKNKEVVGYSTALVFTLDAEPFDIYFIAKEADFINDESLDELAATFKSIIDELGDDVVAGDELRSLMAIEKTDKETRNKIQQLVDNGEFHKRLFSQQEIQEISYDSIKEGFLAISNVCICEGDMDEDIAHKIRTFVADENYKYNPVTVELTRPTLPRPITVYIVPAGKD